MIPELSVNLQIIMRCKDYCHNYRKHANILLRSQSTSNAQQQTTNGNIIKGVVLIAHEIHYQE